MSTPLPNYPLVVGVVSDTATWHSLAEDTPCDIVELRVDALPAAERRLPLCAPCPKPLLLTLRHADEGGACAWDEAERLRLAHELLPAARFLDWEIAHLPGAESLVRAAKERGVRVVTSAHDFLHTPTLQDMLQLEQNARAAGADVVKLAFTPHCEADLHTGSAFLSRCKQPVAIMGMGPEYGPRSRRIYAAQGSVLLYGYLGGRSSAPGQMSAAECRALLRTH